MTPATSPVNIAPAVTVPLLNSVSVGAWSGSWTSEAAIAATAPATRPAPIVLPAAPVWLGVTYGSGESGGRYWLERKQHLHPHVVLYRDH